MIPCKGCGKESPAHSSYAGFCEECRKKELIGLRERYLKYRDLLCGYLQKQGIQLTPATTEGLNEIGRPAVTVKEERHDGFLPLGERQSAIYLFQAADGVMAFPDNGVGLRYIQPPSAHWMNEKADRNRLLAAGSDGKELYFFTEKGEILSTDAAWEKRLMYDLNAGCPEIVQQYFSQEEIRAAEEKFCRNTFEDRYVLIYESPYSSFEMTFYDTSAKKFFIVSAFGSYHDGYEGVARQVSKEEALSRCIMLPFSLDAFIKECEEGIVPRLFCISRLEEKQGEYELPQAFAKGRFSGM